MADTKKNKAKSTGYKVAATTTADLLRDVDGNPPIVSQLNAGERYVIEKVMTVANKDYGKVKDTDGWVDLAKMVRI